MGEKITIKDTPVYTKGGMVKFAIFLGKSKVMFNLPDDQKDDSDLLQSLFYELSNSIKGLNHLKITYKTDIPLLSRIDMHIEKINNLKY